MVLREEGAQRARPQCHPSDDAGVWRSGLERSRHLESMPLIIVRELHLVILNARELSVEAHCWAAVGAATGLQGEDEAAWAR